MLSCYVMIALSMYWYESAKKGPFSGPSWRGLKQALRGLSGGAQPGPYFEPFLGLFYWCDDCAWTHVMSSLRWYVITIQSVVIRITQCAALCCITTLWCNASNNSTLRSKRSIRREQKKVQSTPGNGSTRVRRRRMQGDLIKLSAVAEDAELRSWGFVMIAYHDLSWAF